jgi:hypothetical protein
MAWGTPEGVETLEALRKTGEASLQSFNALRNYVYNVTAAGFPMCFASLTDAPSDALADFYGVTKSIVLNLYRLPQKVIAACN